MTTATQQHPDGEKFIPGSLRDLPADATTAAFAAARIEAPIAPAGIATSRAEKVKCGGAHAVRCDCSGAQAAVSEDNFLVRRFRGATKPL
jgi:hypothetical protein